MRSAQKFRLYRGPLNGQSNAKNWVIVTFHNPRWVPSFEDIFHILRALAECEDEQYPYPARGRWKIKDFVSDSLRPDATWEEIRQKHYIPNRDG